MQKRKKKERQKRKWPQIHTLKSHFLLKFALLIHNMKAVKASHQLYELRYELNHYAICYAQVFLVYPNLTEFWSKK